MLRNRSLLVVAFACLAAACHASLQPKSGGAVLKSAGPAPPSGVTVYQIDPDRSRLRVLVYRAGALARLGHDHVIVAHGLAGWVANPAKPAAASFYLQLPVEEFVVDDAEARAQAGPEFAEPVDDDAKEGTRHNMLSPALLDSVRHPLIQIRALSFVGTEPDLQATVTLSIAGHDSTQVVPFRLRRAAGEVAASAEFPLRQTDLGLTPYSVMMGALRVADQMQVSLELVANAPRGPAPRRR